MQPLDLPDGLDVFDTIEDPNEYTMQIRDWLSKTREIALERVNSTHDKEAGRFNTKRTEIEFKPGDVVLEKKPVGEEGRTTENPWKGPSYITRKLNPVNNEIVPLDLHREPYVVHIERLKLFTLRKSQE